MTRTSRSFRAPDPPVLPVMEELTSSLRLAGIPDPRRVASDIIAALMDVPRSWPMMNGEMILDPEIVEAARESARMLGRGAPFAYAVGSAPFRHLSLRVDERVLIPRPETEVLVDGILERMRARYGPSERWGTAVDVGTGSGAIALALASEGRFDHVIATDTSLDALNVARSNALDLAQGVARSIEFRHGSFMAPLAGVRATLVVSNPPYVSFDEIELLPASVRDWEPPLALFSGANGMFATSAIVRESAGILLSGGLLALEVDETRASLVAELIMSSHCYTAVAVGLDLTGRERFVFASRL